MELIDVRLWPRSYFECSPVVTVIEFIRHMLSRWFVSRCRKIEKMGQDEEIPPAVNKELLKQFNLSTSLTVRELSVWDFDVSQVLPNSLDLCKCTDRGSMGIEHKDWLLSTL
ncbi:unnamed protein product [Microthlaspi erraticum]|uniref:Uncharacterized protein n=1 Tax=Microthlaspi erraticum TaxID=1685480 RepID=A0A6D2I8G6_9BRAS|nr:unnamed protein product [Microthlaspi erraticum]